MADLPPELKKMKRFIREATKVQKVKPVLSYYCRLFAIQEAMRLPAEKKTPATQAWLGEQMTILESTPADCSRDEAKQQLHDFADNVFKVADKQDRDCNATKKTAAAFNTAYVFYEVLKQFGDRDETTEKAAKYCLYKTTDILKALKEGRVPEPGPPGGFGEEEDDELDAEFKKLQGEFGGGEGRGGDGDVPMNSAANDPVAPSQPSYQQPSQPSGGVGGYGGMGGMGGSGSGPAQPAANFPSAYNPYQPQPPSQPQSQPQPPVQPSGYPPYNPPPSQPRQQPKQTPAASTSHTRQPQYRKFESKVKACVEAEKIMKHAFSAMQFNDIPTAIVKLEEALGILKQYEN